MDTNMTALWVFLKPQHTCRRERRFAQGVGIRRKKNNLKTLLRILTKHPYGFSSQMFWLSFVL